jgi:hypothetical protein
MEININKLKSIPTYQTLYQKKYGIKPTRQLIYTRIRKGIIQSATIDGKVFVIVNSDGTID